MLAEFKQLLESADAIADAVDRQDWSTVEQIDQHIPAQVQAAVAAAGDQKVRMDELVPILAKLKEVHEGVLAKAKNHRQKAADDLRQLNKGNAAANAYQKSNRRY